jgi:Holliday junction DNA helicase RuvA
MYAYIRGEIISKKEEFLVVENAGIGYKIFCHPPMQDRFGKTGDKTQVYTYLYVREDTFALYGFPTQEEHDMFILLLQVSGIGPKVALAIVAQVSPSEFALSVITGDVKRLTQVKGVGKKGAERLILELKDKLKGFAFAATDNEGGVDDLIMTTNSGSVRVNEAMSAMIVLGYSPVDARKAVMSVFSDDLSVEEVIRKALKALL